MSSVKYIVQVCFSGTEWVNEVADDILHPNSKPKLYDNQEEAIKRAKSYVVARVVQYVDT
jgi:hypothetical protein